jgi:hypothetical protein
VDERNFDAGRTVNPLAGRTVLLVSGALALLVFASGCSFATPASGNSAQKSSVTRDAVASSKTAAPVVVAAGDIASCEEESGHEATARLLDDTGGTVLTLGDNAYEDGTPEEFAGCYDPSWGRHKDRTKPSPGNHDYETAGAGGYFGYFGNAAGDPGKGYYSYDVGDWHLISLNSNCEDADVCSPGSPQVRWLQNDLKRNRASCTLAYWHHPYFSSGEEHGSTPEVRPLWEALYDAGADVVLSGHEHNYERFGPQDADGQADPGGGIRQFVVGTGGAGHYDISTPLPNSEVTNDDTFGVLKLTLRPDGYDWRFVPVAGETLTDSGSAGCS